MANIFRVDNDMTIIRAGNVVLSEGLRPRRIVLRDLGSKYVTHCELLDISIEQDGEHQALVARSDGFDQGHYFDYGHNSLVSKDEAREAAIKDFQDRVSRL